MRFFCDAFLTALAAQLRTRKTWVLALLLPGLIWAMLLAMPPAERTAPVRVGVALPTRGGEAFWAALEPRGGGAVTFIAADEDTVIARVAAGQWDCGLLLPQDFAQRLQALDTRRLVTLCVSDGSTVYPLVRETVSACLTELAGPGIAAEYLLDSGIATQNTLPRMMPRLTQSLAQAQRVGIAAETPDGGPLSTAVLADGTITGLFHGMIAIVLLLWAVFNAMDLGRWLATPFARRARAVRGATALLLPRALAAAVPLLVVAAAAVCLLPAAGRALWPLLPYLAALVGFSLLAARCKAVWTALPVLAPAIPAICLLTSPILFDLTGLLPAWLTRWTPVTLYLRACGGDLPAGLLLLGCGAGAAMLSAGLDALPARA